MFFLCFWLDEKNQWESEIKKHKTSKKKKKKTCPASPASSTLRRKRFLDVLMINHVVLKLSRSRFFWNGWVVWATTSWAVGLARRCAVGSIPDLALSLFLRRQNYINRCFGLFLTKQLIRKYAPPPTPNTINTPNEGRFRLNVDSP